MQKYSASRLTQINCITLAVHPTRGAYRDRHGRGAGCDGRERRLRRQRFACGRRSRVVLTPRRWRQVGSQDAADDGDKKARSPGRVRRKPLKPLRAGMPGDFRCDRCEYSCAFCTTTSHTRLRVHWAPGIPHALFWGRRFLHNPGASRRGKAESRLGLHPGMTGISRHRRARIIEPATIRLIC